MKTLLLIIALFAFTFPVTAQQEPVLLTPMYHSELANWDGVKFDDEEYGILRLGTRYLPWVMWALPITPQPDDSIGFDIVLPEGMQILFTSSEFGGNFQVMGMLDGPYDGEYKVLYTKDKNAGSGYVQLQVPRFKTNRTPNGSDNVLIDCAYLHTTRLSVDPIDRIIETFSHNWYDVTGRTAFYGTRAEIQQSGLSGMYFSVEGKYVSLP